MKNFKKIQERFGLNIKSLRRCYKLTQTKLNDECDFSQITLVRIEKGILNDLIHVIKLADYFGVSVDFILRTDLFRMNDSEIKEAIEKNKIPSMLLDE